MPDVPTLHVEALGDAGPRLVLVHGSTAPGWRTWSRQRALADRFRLVVPHLSGYPPGPRADSIDYEREADAIADLLEPGDHLVGHSYGGVVALFAAGRAEATTLGSLTVIEPPAFGLAAGLPATRRLMDRFERLIAENLEPRAFLQRFLFLNGIAWDPPDPLEGELLQSTMATMVERAPWDSEPPLDAIRDAGIRSMVVSGDHSQVYDAICDAIATRLDARRGVLPNAGHAAQMDPAFNEVLSGFVMGSG